MVLHFWDILLIQHPLPLGLFWYAAAGMDLFVVGLTNDDPAKKAPVFKESYTVYVQPSGDKVASSAGVIVQFLPLSEKFRYVIVQNSPNITSGLCLKSVEVYDPITGRC